MQLITSPNRRSEYQTQPTFYPQLNQDYAPQHDVDKNLTFVFNLNSSSHHGLLCVSQNQFIYELDLQYSKQVQGCKVPFLTLQVYFFSIRPIVSKKCHYPLKFFF
jgi:hypothetical protein